MADIRINALATTAASTASDDFVAVDGSANGTRKLNAYSPTFGGNLTVSGTGTFSGQVNVALSTNTNLSGLHVSNSLSDNLALRLNNTLSGGKDWYLLSGATSAPGTLRIFNATDAVVAATFSSTGNATLSGNLTVSGTGASSFAGRLSISSTTGVGLQTALAVSSSSGLGVFTDYTKTSGTSRTWSLGATGSSSSAGDNAFALYDGTAAAFRFLVTSGGNVLIGTTTDSANGKLQLATHTTSAGGIGFGTDTSLFRSSANTLRVGAGGSFLLLAPDGTTYNLQVYRSAADAILRLTKEGVADWDFFAGTDLVIKRNNTTALTLDSSQNATFAGAITGKQTIAFPATANAVTIPNGISLSSGYSVGYLSFYNGSGGKVDGYVTSNNLIISDNVRMAGLPTSSAGLSSGQLWIDTANGRVIKVVA